MSMMGALFFLPPFSFFQSRPESLFTSPSTPSMPFYQSPSGHSQPVWPGLPLAVPLRWISCLAAGPSASSLCLEPRGVRVCMCYGVGVYVRAICMCV